MEEDPEQVKSFRGHLRSDEHSRLGRRNVVYHGEYSDKENSSESDDEGESDSESEAECASEGIEGMPEIFEDVPTIDDTMEGNETPKTKKVLTVCMKCTFG